MSNDEIISMAHECHVPVDWRVKNLVRFANLVAARERESCAKVCDAERVIHKSVEYDQTGGACAFAAAMCAKEIRARGDKDEQ